MAKTPIWAEPEPGKRKPGHSRQAIAAAAVKIADTEGIEAVSMRRVAAELGAGTMTLYHYVRDKDDLRTLMLDAVMGELILDEDAFEPGDWRAGLRAIAHTSKRCWDRHKWMFDGAVGTDFGPNGMRHFEQSLSTVASLDLEPQDRMHLISLVDEFVLGYVARREQDVAESSDPGFFERASDYIIEMLGTGDYPLASSLIGGGEDGRAKTIEFFEQMIASDRFDKGLEILLDGIEVFLRERGAIAD